MFWPKVYRGWWIVATGYLAQLATVGSFGFVFGVLLAPMQRDLGWSRSEIVGVITLARLIGGIVATALGPIADRFGARLMMVLSALLAGTSLVGTAASDGKLAYYLCWAAFGLSIPGLTTVGPAVAISNWFIRKRPQAVMYYTFGSATAGVILAPLMAGVAASSGWRTAWLLMAALFFAIAPLAWLAVRRRPEDVGLLPDAGAPRFALDREGRSVDRERAAEPEPAWTVKQAVRSRSFWLLTVGFMLTSLPASSIFIHMSSFVESKGFSSGAGATAVSVYGAGVLAGRFVWGSTVSRIGIHRALVAYGASYGLSIFLFVLPHSLPAIYATTALLGLGIAGAQQLNVQAFPDFFGRRIVGALFGYSSLAVALAGPFAPLLAAAAYDRNNSYSAVFLLFAVLCLLAAVAFFFSKPTWPSGEKTSLATGPAA